MLQDALLRLSVTVSLQKMKIKYIIQLCVNTIHYWQKVITVLAQHLYYIIGNLLRYWLYYISIITLQAVIMLLVVITLLVALSPSECTGTLLTQS